MITILIHYTTNEEVYSVFEKEYYDLNFYKNQDIFDKVDKYYKKYHQTQNCLLLINYFNTTIKRRELLIGKIVKQNESYRYIRLEKDLSNKIYNKIGRKNMDEYKGGVYFSYFYIDFNDEFYLKKIPKRNYKIRLKYFSWDELIKDSEVLHEEIIKIIFNKENVLNLATTKNTEFVLQNKKILDETYIRALYMVGFVSEHGLNVSEKSLHGDIGEFLMNYLIRKYIMKNNPDSFFLPKLAFKTNSNMPVYGSDGTFYNLATKNIYYLESKFHQNLKHALDDAVDSINKHKNINDFNFIYLNIEKFRNLANNKFCDYIEITEDIEENYIIFLMCGDKYKIEDVENIIEDNDKLKVLKEFDRLQILVLPVLDKNAFFKLFKEVSEREGAKYNV